MSLDLTRRRFLRGVGLVGVAPLVVKTAGLLMPIKAPLVEAHTISLSEMPAHTHGFVRIVAMRNKPDKPALARHSVVLDPDQIVLGRRSAFLDPEPAPCSPPSSIPQREYLVDGLPISDVHHRVIGGAPKGWVADPPRAFTTEMVEFTTYDLPMYRDPMFCGAKIHVETPFGNPGEYRVVSVEELERRS